MSKTALVTGASEGIGAEFAKILANLGYDLILVARSEDKLNQLADRLRSEFEVNSAVIVADLSKANAAQDLNHYLVATHIRSYLQTYLLLH